MEDIKKELIKGKYKKKRGIKVGHTVQVDYINKLGYWSSKRFIGLCISIQGGNISKMIILRNVINNISVEFSFYRNSNLIINLKTLPKRKVRKIRKSKLFYLRKMKKNASKV